LLRDPLRPAAPDDRRPARPRRPRRQARRLRPGPLPRHAAAPVPRPYPRPRPAGPAARRAGVRPRPAGPRGAARAAPRAPLARQDDPHQQPHPSRARGALHERRDRRPRPGPRPGSRRGHREAPPLRRGAPRPRPRRARGDRGGPRLLRRGGPRGVGGDPRRRPDRAGVPRRRRRIGRPARASDRWRDPGRQLRPRRERPRGAVPAGHVGQRPRGGRVSEAGQPREVTAAVVAATDATLDPGRTAGITAIWIRELRGRMRGKRAFLFLTFYLSLLGGILWLTLRTTEGMGGLTATQAMGLGRGIFGGVLLIETLVVIA